MKVSRRDFLKLSAAGLGGGAAASLFPSVLRAARRRPNVLFIAVDDLRPQLRCYGHGRMISPNIDALAQGGILFERAYCQQAVCSPSRTSLMTGLRPDSTRVYDLRTHFRDTVPDVVTLPQHFIGCGYHAAGLGKIYHGGLNDERSWSEPWQKPGGSGSKSYNLGENRELIAKRRAEARGRGLKGRDVWRSARGPAFEGADVPDEAYPDGATAEAAIATMRRLAGQSRPFFLGVGFLKPHLPFNCPKRYWDLYDRDEIDLADNPFRPDGAPDIAMHNWGELRAYHGIPKKGPLPDDQARTLIHGYYACVSCTDAQIGKLLAELDRHGLRDDTLVVLWGDHGWHLGDHGLWCKHTNFETAVRVPMIVRAPGLGVAGSRTRGLSEFVDIYPSLCELAGLPVPDHLEGTSFVPLMKEPDRVWKRAAFSQYPRGRGVMGHSMRTDRYRYTEWRDVKGGGLVAAELYDHVDDPRENANVSGGPENAALVKRLSAMLKAGWKGALPGRP